MAIYSFDSAKSINGKQYTDFENNILFKKGFVMLVYANWCGHCQRMKPAWENVKMNAQNQENIVQIEESAMNALRQNNSTLGSIIERIVVGYPTVVYIHSIEPNNTLKYITFRGTRDQESIEDFVKKSSKTKRTKPESKSKSSKSENKSKSETRPKSKILNKSNPKQAKI